MDTPSSLVFEKADSAWAVALARAASVAALVSRRVEEAEEVSLSASVEREAGIFLSSVRVAEELTRAALASASSWPV